MRISLCLGVLNNKIYSNARAFTSYVVIIMIPLLSVMISDVRYNLQDLNQMMQQVRVRIKCLNNDLTQVGVEFIC